MQMKAQQEALPKVKWDDKEAENCWHFPYLGAIFEAGGGQLADVQRRIMLATARFGKMRHVWKAKALHLRLRMRLYIASVCSILTYGAEAWCLDRDICRKINGANSRMVSVITGRTQHEEAKEGSRSFDLIRAIRARRLSWLGHILRLDDDRLLAKAVRHCDTNMMSVVRGTSCQTLQKLRRGMNWRRGHKTERNGGWEWIVWD